MPMLSALLFSVGFGLIAAVPADSASATAKSDLAAYEALQRKVGSDPAAHIKLALWCEAHELKAEEMKHLALAVLHDPKNIKARGLMGLASYRGSWQRPE